MNNKLMKVKLKGNESFNIREGWLRKGIRCIKEYPNLFSRNDVMEILGVGSKMVKSIRFWLQATGLTTEIHVVGGRVREQIITDDFGRIIDRFDPYFDDIFTLWLIHAHIVANDNCCMVWNIFFNEYEGKDFTKENMVEVMNTLLIKKMEEGASFSENSFADDCSSVLKMYLNTSVSDDPEDDLSSPLTELGLIQKSDKIKNAYFKSIPSLDKLDKLAVLYVMLRNFEDNKYSVSIQDLLEKKNNIGKVFNLSRVLINEYLDQLRISSYLTINRTAGLDMVYVDESLTPDIIMIKYYEQAMVR